MAPSMKQPITNLDSALWATQGLLALTFFSAGAMKLVVSQEFLTTQGMAWAGRMPAELIPLIGTAEVLGAIGLLLPWYLHIAPKLTPWAALGLVTVMALGATEHAMAGELLNIAPPLVLGGLAAFVAWGRLRTPSTHPTDLGIVRAGLTH